MFSVYKHTHTTTQARKPVCIFGNSCHVCASNNFFPFTNLTILASLLCGSMSYTSIRIHIKCMQNPKTKTIPCTHYYFFHSFGHSFHSLVLHHIIFGGRVVVFVPKTGILMGEYATIRNESVHFIAAHSLSKRVNWMCISFRCMRFHSNDHRNFFGQHQQCQWTAFYMPCSLEYVHRTFRIHLT